MTEQTLRPYSPTWRDKLGAYLYDHTSGSPEARQFVGGLVGSTGLGKTGPGLIDAVPFVNSALQGEEAIQNKDPKGLAYAMLPLPPMPGTKYPGALQNFMRDQNGWIAWHGSPHKYDRVDLSKVGTGEGAQAYGHGYYVAEHPEVAEDYRKSLAGLNSFHVFDAKGNNVDEFANEDFARSLAEQLGGRYEKAAGSPGYLYKLDIKPEQERFLDWDKPLSEQHPSVQEALRKRYGAHYDKMVQQNYSGGDIAGRIENLTHVNEMAQAGLPGIKYLDAGSRGGSEATRNYVIFDPQHVELLERNGIPVGGMPPVK